MPEQLDVAIVGAGPYGLSVAAHLRELRVRAFGEPMHTWRTRMPPDMLLRSDWEETSLSAPGGAGTIDRWAREVTGEPRQEPIPLQKFLRYADWFRGRFVRENDPSTSPSRTRRWRFRLTTAAGEEDVATQVVLAVGVTVLVRAASVRRGDGRRRQVRDRSPGLRAYASRRVLVVGGGQGGLESARSPPRRGGGRADRALEAALVR